MIQQGSVSGDSLRIDRDDDNDVFFKVSYSEEFEILNEPIISCEIIQETTYLGIETA